MYIVYALLFGVLLSLGTVGDLANTSYGNGVSSAKVDSFRHEIFVRVSERYISKNPTTTGTLTWAQIKGQAPPVFSETTFTNDFLLSIDASGNAFQCGKLRSDAAVNIAINNLKDRATLLLGSGRFITAKSQSVANSNRTACP